MKYISPALVIIYAMALALVAVPCIAAIELTSPLVSRNEGNTAVSEIWGYLLEGAENAYKGNEPVTDLCYFRAIIDYKGRLIGATKIPGSVPVNKNVRRHLVVAELSNRSLEHFILSPDYKFRSKLIDDIAAAMDTYDGVQIDFEAVPDIDKNNYLTFLADVKKRVGKKIVSVAVPARHQPVNDAYNYDALNSVVDRIIVMAYDEHWNGSVPGPIASLEWGEKIALYATAHIAKEKLVMGIPLYGRSWQRHGYSRELSYADAESIIRQSGQRVEFKENEYPSFEYSKPVNVVLYYENNSSIMGKFRLYRKCDVRSVAFWRLGQGPEGLWEELQRETAINASSVN
jgi:spore germination protein YaaH